MIPEAAVEAAAIVLWDKEMNAPWSSVADGFKAPFLRDARRALEAGAPHMLAGGVMSTECEAEERNQRALYLLQNEWGCGRIDVGELARILRGDACDHADGGA